MLFLQEPERRYATVILSRSSISAYAKNKLVLAYLLAQAGE